MPIRPSPGAEIRKLIDALGGTDNVKREAAIARLAVIGQAAADRLVQDFPTASDPHTRAGMLRALESTADPRSVALARAALAREDGEVAAAAVAVLRRFATVASDASQEALEVLVATALDPTVQADLRLATFEALRDFPAAIFDPVRRKLAADADAIVRGAARASGSGDEEIDRAWRGAMNGDLPDTPEQMKEALQAFGAAARLTELQRLVDRIRWREGQEGQVALRREWRVVRGAVHQILAERGSRLAIYDLRDSLLDPEPLPVGFLAAVEEVGDSSCIEPLAATYEASSRSGDVWWRDHVANAFRAIVHREGLTRRHLVVKRALNRWPEATAELMGRT